MRLTALTIASALTLSAAAQVCQAGNLGPVGEGRRAWLKLPPAEWDQTFGAPRRATSPRP